MKENYVGKLILDEIIWIDVLLFSAAISYDIISGQAPPYEYIFLDAVLVAVIIIFISRKVCKNKKQAANHYQPHNPQMEGTTAYV